MPIADKALSILRALAPLYSEEFMSEPLEERERKKASVLKLVKTLAFPYLDTDTSHPRVVDSPNTTRPPNSVLSTSSTSHLPYDSTQSHPPHSHQTQTQLPVSSMRWAPPHAENNTLPSYSPNDVNQRQIHLPSVSQTLHGTSIPPHHRPLDPTQNPTSGYSDFSYSGYSTMHQQNPSSLDTVDHHGNYVHPADDGGMWGASIGFGVGEWAQFLTVMQPQRPDSRIR